MASSTFREVHVEAHRDLTKGIPRIHELVERVVSSVWHELGLPSRPQLIIESGAADVPLTVMVDGERLPLSARRILMLAFAAAGRPYKSGAVDAHSWLDLLVDRRPEHRATALSWLLEATLKAAISRLVERDKNILVPHRLSAASPFATTGLVLAAELGLAPSQLPLHILAKELTPAVNDPWAWCERLVDQPARTGVTIHVARTSLRRLTTGAQPLTGELLAMPMTNQYERGVFDALLLQHGIQAPTLSLDVNNAVREDVVVLRFGGVTAPPVGLLADGVEALDPTHVTPHEADVIGYTVDPVYGGQWPLVTTAVAERLSKPGSSGRYGAARFLLRFLLAEVQCRLGWYPPIRSSIPWDREMRPWRGPIAAALEEHRSVVFRWLLADRATVHYEDPIFEGMARGLVSGRLSVPDLITEARLALQGAVLGPVLLESNIVMVTAAPDLVDECLEASSPWPLLDHYPGLWADPRTQVLVVPAAARSRVQQLMRPLIDTVLVVAAEELGRAVLPPPRDLV